MVCQCTLCGLLHGTNERLAKAELERLRCDGLTPSISTYNDRTKHTWYRYPKTAVKDSSLELERKIYRKDQSNGRPVENEVN